MSAARAVSANPSVQHIRHFNRFYTKQIGVLQAGLLSSPFSLLEVRILYEVAHRQNLTAALLVQELGVDAGYLSRLLAKFEKQRLLRRTRSPADGRQHYLSLTRKGHSVFRPLEQRSNEQVALMLDRLGPTQQQRLLAAMHTIEAELGTSP